MLRFFLFLCFASILISCTSPKEKIPDSYPMQTNSGKIIIYQVLPRLFGNKLSTNKPYGTIEENGVGKFNDINQAALEGITELGVSHVWYTGVIEHAQLSDYTAHGIPQDDADVVKGRAGSPYSIKDYYDVDPDLAVSVPDRMKEFEKLIERTHEAGLKVIIDFVPNHVARKYYSDSKPAGVKDLGEDDNTAVAFDPDNNFYYLPGESFQPPPGYVPLGADSFPTKDGKFDETPTKATGNDKFASGPAVDDWFESVKLNYGVDIQNNRKAHFDPIPNTWMKMKAILNFWAEMKIDGFRCDMAEMVPVEFWQWVIPQVKSINPDLLFIAEIYNPAQYRNYITTGKFDFLYDKVQLYDTLKLVLGGKAGTQAIAEVQNDLADLNGSLLHFLENHDEQRIASPFFVNDIWKAVPAMTISAMIDRGPVMIYFGQEVGEPGAGEEGFGSDDGRTTIFDYWGVPNHQAWMNDGKFDGGRLTMEQKQLRQIYADILHLCRDNPAISQGEYFDLTLYNLAQNNLPERVHAFARTYGEQRLVIVSGFNDQLEKVRLTIPPEVVKKMKFDETRKYIGRDLLRSGLDIGLDSTFSFNMDVFPYTATVIKIK
jgi:glycosidase